MGGPPKSPPHPPPSERPPRAPPPLPIPPRATVSPLSRDTSLPHPEATEFRRLYAALRISSHRSASHARRRADRDHGAGATDQAARGRRAGRRHVGRLGALG